MADFIDPDKIKRWGEQRLQHLSTPVAFTGHFIEALPEFRWRVRTLGPYRHSTLQQKIVHHNDGHVEWRDVPEHMEPENG